MAPSGQPASWIGRFVRVYKRPRSGFQFSPIISNSRMSWQDLSGTLLFLSFRLSFFLFLFLSPCPLVRPSSLRRFFCLQTAGAFSKLPTWEDLSSAPTSPGSPITSCRYYRERKRCPGRKRSPCERGCRGCDRRIPFPGFMGQSPRAPSM